jgi:hypothetical protein
MRRGVVAKHSPSKNGIAYDGANPSKEIFRMDARVEPAHDGSVS